MAGLRVPDRPQNRETAQWYETDDWVYLGGCEFDRVSDWSIERKQYFREMRGISTAQGG